MKTRILALAIAALCSLLFSRNAAAQGCALTLTPHYSQYVSRSLDTSDNIYQTVQLDGYADVGISATCPMSTAVHHPTIYNSIGSQGGFSSGPGACASCYVSYSTTLVFPAQKGTEYPDETDSTMVCDLAGTFWSTGDSSFLSVHHTTYSFSYVSDGICTYSVFCPTSPHICGPDTVTAAPPCSSTYLITSWLKVRVGIYSTCFPGLARNSNTPEACD